MRQARQARSSSSVRAKSESGFVDAGLASLLGVAVGGALTQGVEMLRQARSTRQACRAAVWAVGGELFSARAVLDHYKKHPQLDPGEALAGLSTTAWEHHGATLQGHLSADDALALFSAYVAIRRLNRVAELPQYGSLRELVEDTDRFIKKAEVSVLVHVI